MDTVSNLSDFILYLFQVIVSIIYTFSCLLLFVLYQNYLLSRIEHLRTLHSLRVPKHFIITCFSLEATIWFGVLGSISYFVGRKMGEGILLPLYDFTFSNFGILIEDTTLVMDSNTIYATIVLILVSITVCIGNILFVTLRRI